MATECKGGEPADLEGVKASRVGSFGTSKTAGCTSVAADEQSETHKALGPTWSSGPAKPHRTPVLERRAEELCKNHASAHRLKVENEDIHVRNAVERELSHDSSSVQRGNRPLTGLGVEADGLSLPLGMDESSIFPNGFRSAGNDTNRHCDACISSTTSGCVTSSSGTSSTSSSPIADAMNSIPLGGLSRRSGCEPACAPSEDNDIRYYDAGMVVSYAELDANDESFDDDLYATPRDVLEPVHVNTQVTTDSIPKPTDTVANSTGHKVGPNVVPFTRHISVSINKMTTPCNLPNGGAPELPNNNHTKQGFLPRQKSTPDAKYPPKSQEENDGYMVAVRETRLKTRFKQAASQLKKNTKTKQLFAGRAQSHEESSFFREFPMESCPPDSCCESKKVVHIRLDHTQHARVTDGILGSPSLRRHIAMADKLDDLLELMTSSGWCLARLNKVDWCKPRTVQKDNDLGSDRDPSYGCTFTRCACDDSTSSNNSSPSGSRRGSKQSGGDNDKANGPPPLPGGKVSPNAASPTPLNADIITPMGRIKRERSVPTIHHQTGSEVARLNRKRSEPMLGPRAVTELLNKKFLTPKEAEDLRQFLLHPKPGGT